MHGAFDGSVDRNRKPADMCSRAVAATNASAMPLGPLPQGATASGSSSKGPAASGSNSKATPGPPSCSATGSGGGNGRPPLMFSDEKGHVIWGKVEVSSESQSLSASSSGSAEVGRQEQTVVLRDVDPEEETLQQQKLQRYHDQQLLSLQQQQERAGLSGRRSAEKLLASIASQGNVTFKPDESRSQESSGSVEGQLADRGSANLHSLDKDGQDEDLPDIDDRRARWSEGSELHHEGGCKPCAWVWKANGCINGTKCEFCHTCEFGQLKVKKKERQAMLKQRSRRHERYVAL